MEIFQIINRLSLGGAERLVIDLSKTFAAKGVTVHLIVLSRKNNQELVDEISGVDYIVFHSLSVRSLYDPRIFFRLASSLRHASIIHLHLFPTLYWGALYKLVFFWRRQKIYFTEHSTENNRREKKIFKLVERMIYGKLEKIVCISNATRANLLTHLGSKFAHKLTIINNGLDYKKFELSNPFARQRLGVEANDFIVIQVASFRPAKDQKTLIRALTYLPEQIKVVFVGDGALREDCESLVAELNLNKRFLFMGQQNNVAELVKMSDIMVVSSIYEGFGIAAIEGMACRKPVVASNVPGLAEIVKNFGIVFTQGDSCELAGIIEKLYSDEELALSVALACEKRSYDFKIENVADKYLKVYKDEVNI